MSGISKTVLYICGAMVFGMASSLSWAETQKGSSELSLYGFGFDSSGSRNLTVNVEYGYYFTDQVRGIFGLSASGNEDDVTFGARSGVVYDFSPQGNTTYLGGVVNTRDLSDARDSSFGYVYVGYRNWLSENTAFFVQGGYARALRGGGDAGIAEFGITVFFN